MCRLIVSLLLLMLFVLMVFNTSGQSIPISVQRGRENEKQGKGVEMGNARQDECFWPSRQTGMSVALCRQVKQLCHYSQILMCAAPCCSNSDQISEGCMAMQCEMVSCGLVLVEW